MQHRRSSLVLAPLLALGLVTLTAPTASAVADGSALALVWTAFGLAASLLGRRFGRLSLAAHGAAYLAAAAVPSGLLAVAVSAFRYAPAGAPAFPGPAAAAVAVAAVRSSPAEVARVLLVAFDDATAQRYERLLAEG